MMIARAFKPVLYLVTLLLPFARAWLPPADNYVRHEHRRHVLMQGTVSTSQTRRTIVEGAALWCGVLAGLGPWAAARAEGTRVKGAFELDMEYYLKDLLRGNPTIGAVEQSPIQVRPARRIDAGLATFLDSTMIDQIARVSSLPREEVISKVVALRRAVEPAFQRRSPFRSGDLEDEYFFDMAQYASFRVAAKEIPNLNARVTLVRGIGEKVLEKVADDLTKEKIFVNKKRLVLATPDAQAEGLEGAIEGLRVILQYLAARRFIRDYKINAEDYDLDSWNSGFPIELQVSVFEPATLGGNLQFTGEGMLFHPDFVQETLLAYIRLCHVSKAKSFQFFLDTQYRENPKDYAPTEVLYSMVLERDRALS